MKIEDLPDDKLEEQLKYLKTEKARREKEKEKHENQRRLGLIQEWHKNIDIILKLVPNHSLTTCSDRYINDLPTTCLRCFLLRSKENWCWYDDQYKINITLEKW